MATTSTQLLYRDREIVNIKTPQLKSKEMSKPVHQQSVASVNAASCASQSNNRSVRRDTQDSQHYSQKVSRQSNKKRTTSSAMNTQSNASIASKFKGTASKTSKSKSRKSLSSEKRLYSKSLQSPSKSKSRSPSVMYDGRHSAQSNEKSYGAQKSPLDVQDLSQAPADPPTKRGKGGKKKAEKRRVNKKIIK